VISSIIMIIAYLMKESKQKEKTDLPPRVGLSAVTYRFLADYTLNITFGNYPALSCLLCSTA